MAERNRLYTRLNTGNAWLKNNLAGWSEDAYRDLLTRHGATEKNGRISATTMNLTQLEQASREMTKLGFRPARVGNKKTGNWRAPRIAKLNAIWCAMADQSIVENRSQEAMQRWCVNQVKGLTRLQWATSDQLNKAVEMMKRMAAGRGVEIDP